MFLNSSVFIFLFFAYSFALKFIMLSALKFFFLNELYLRLWLCFVSGHRLLGLCHAGFVIIPEICQCSSEPNNRRMLILDTRS